MWGLGVVDEEVLNFWQEGRSRLEIARELRIEPKDVHRAIMRGRRRSPPDPRAVQRDRIERVKAANARNYDKLRPGGGPTMAARRKLARLRAFAKQHPGSKRELIEILERWRAEQ